MFPIRLYQAGEQTSTNLKEFAQNNGICLEYSPPYASQSNGLSERQLQEIWKMARTFLFESRLDLRPSDAAISHADWLRNRFSASRIVLQVPCKLWFNQEPNFRPVLKFGQPGYAFQYRLDSYASKKALAKEIFGHFVGMQTENVLYRIYSLTLQSMHPMLSCWRLYSPKQNAQVSTFSIVLDQISKRRVLEEVECVQESHCESVSLNVFILFMLTFSSAFKAKGRDYHIPANL